MKYLLIFPFLFSSFDSVASDDEYLDKVVVTGTSIPVNITEFPSDVTVIDHQYIESSHARDVSELLKAVPGVFVDQAGGRGGVSSIYLRGADPNFTLILLDGVKLNDPNNSRGGSFDLSTLGTENIERIEIVKGPQSAVYGSDAIAGVVNIITYDGNNQVKNSVDISAQTKGGYRLLTESRGKNSSFSYSLSASYIDDGEPTKGNRFKSPTFISNLGYSVDKLEIKSISRFSYIDSASFPDDSGGPEFAVLRETEKRELIQFLTGVKIIHLSGEKWVNNVNLFLTHTDEDIDSPGVAPGIRDPFGIPPNSSDSEYTRLEAEYTTILNIASVNNLSFGIDTQYERGKSSGTLFAQQEIPTNFKEERFTVSPLFELKLNLIRNTYIFAGGRMDYTDKYGTEFSPHLGILYNLQSTGTSISANWGEGFKLPSFFALGNSIVGNDELKPETSNSIDFKVSQELFNDVFSFAASAFYNNFSNLIDFDEGPPPRLINRDKVVTKGFEFEMKTRKVFNTVLSGNLSYIKSNIKNSADNLRNRPEWLANFTVIWTPKNFLEIFTNINYVGSYFDSSIPTGEVEIGDYLLVDSAVTIYIKESLKVYFKIENIFDQKYQQVVGFDAPGIRPGGGVQWNF